MAVCFWKSEALLTFLAHPLPDHIAHRAFLQTGPLAALLPSISIPICGGLLLALPVASYQLSAFVIPAFAEEYHKPLRPLVLMIPALFICGVVFGWYLVVPP